MSNLLLTIGLLICSNLFMTFAWYAHLRVFPTKSLFFVIIVSWFLALFEYIFQVPGNRIGYQQAHLTLPQLKILQEIITLGVFIPFAVYYMKQEVNWNFSLGGIVHGGCGIFYF